MAYWTCQGEAGKALDATTRDLDQIGAVRPVLSFVSLGVDTLRYSVLLKDLTPTTEVLPERGQKFTVFRNGTRFFTGHCSERRQSGYVVNITISGPGWWLERLNLTTLQTDSASRTAERLSFVFPTQSLTTSVNDLLTRAINLGAPIGIGSLAATFSCPRITLNQSTVGQALAEMIRLTPDVSGWWDYSTATPTFNTARRSSMTTRTLAAADLGEDGFEVYPLDELRAEFVRIPYVARGTDGRRVFREQVTGDEGTARANGGVAQISLALTASNLDDTYNGMTIQIVSGTGAGQSRTITDYNGSTRTAYTDTDWATKPTTSSVYKIGTGLPASTGTTQMLVVSGEELDTFLPNEIFDSVFVKTAPVPTSSISTALRDYIKAADPYLAGLVQEYGSISGAPGTVQWYYSGGVEKHEDFPGFALTDPQTGEYISGSDRDNIVILGDLPEWFKKIWPVYKANLTCTWLWTQMTSSSLIPSSPAAWVAMIGNSVSDIGAVGGKVNSVSSEYYHWVAVPVSFQVSLIGNAYTNGSTVYRPADYDFIAPPAGFAAGMLESQGWTPYAGRLEFDSEEAGGTRYRGCKVNVTGALPEYATMGALVESETLDLETGHTTLQLGAPARLDYRTFVDRIRRTAQDNIVYV